MIFYLNALGLLIDGSRWGVWIIELVFLMIAAYLSLIIYKRSFGVYPALIAIFLWLFRLSFIIEGGNLTTEYTLPLQFLCIFLAYQLEKGFFPWNGFLIGLICSISFFTKQNTIGIGIAIALYILFSRIKRKENAELWKYGSVIFLGALPFTLLIVIYFLFQESFSVFWNSVFQYNFIYSETSMINRYHALLEVLNVLPILFLLGILGWCGGLAIVISSKPIDKAFRSLIIVCLIDLPIELLFVSISGKTHAHYYMALLPITSFFSALAFWLLFRSIPKYFKKVPLHLVFTFSFLFISILGKYNEYLEQVSRYKDIRRDINIVNYIEDSTAKDDNVLFWGAQTRMNFFSRRKSPTRFVYQNPLYHDNYTNKELIEEFLLDITHNQPMLIIDTKDRHIPYLEFDIESESISNNLDYIRSHYLLKDKLGDWDVYEYVDVP